MGEPFSHILRPNVPWRDDLMTECGRDASEFARVLTGDEAVALVREHGQQRAAFLLCMTCMSTCRRHAYGGKVTAEPTTWRNDPIEVLQRYVGGMRYGQSEKRDRTTAELQAIGALIEAHREEFDEYVVGATDASSLSEARAKKQRRLTDQHRTRKL